MSPSQGWNWWSTSTNSYIQKLAVGYSISRMARDASERTLPISRVAVLAGGSLSRVSRRLCPEAPRLGHPPPGTRQRAHHAGDTHRLRLREGGGHAARSHRNGPPTGHRSSDEAAAQPTGTCVGNHSRPAHPDRRATGLGGLDADVTHTAPQTARQCSPSPGTVRSAPVALDSPVTNEG